MSLTLRHVPLWSQQRDLDPATGGPGANWANNCGPESLAVAVKYFSDVELYAETIKDVLYGQTYQGYTDWDHLGRYLYLHCGCTCGVYTATDKASGLAHIKAYLDRQHIAIGLFYADIPAQAGGHFSPIIGYTGDGAGHIVTLTRMNVWDAKLETFDVPGFLRAWQGEVMEVHRKRAIAAW